MGGVGDGGIGQDSSCAYNGIQSEAVIFWGGDDQFIDGEGSTCDVNACRAIDVLNGDVRIVGINSCRVRQWIWVDLEQLEVLQGDSKSPPVLPL